MFSALKKLTHRSESSSGSGSNGGTPGSHGGTSVQSLPHSLQRKFARGCDYNLKLLLRGDRSSGKTALFNRLQVRKCMCPQGRRLYPPVFPMQGGSFKEDYIASEEIGVTDIQWNHKATDDIVKVQVWDVVDKGKKRIKLEGLKLDSSGGTVGSAGASSSSDFSAALDAQFVDVYKGAHGVIFLFDITKQWTFDYVTRELSHVPSNVPVLILANFMDRKHHRCITRDQVIGFIEESGKATTKMCLKLIDFFHVMGKISSLLRDFYLARLI